MITCLITPPAGLYGIREADRLGMKSLEFRRDCVCQVLQIEKSDISVTLPG
jgi:hypothetical protein